MKSLKMTSILVAIIAVFTISAGEARAVTAYMQIEGAQQGVIEGSVTGSPEYENWIAVGSFGHNFTIAVDPVTGRSSSQRVHHPIRVVIPFDKSAPQLYSALASGEALQRVEIHFLRPNRQTGTDEHFFTLLLEGARIIGISPSLIPSNDLDQMMTTVSIQYQTITLTHEIDSREFTDTYSAQQ